MYPLPGCYPDAPRFRANGSEKEQVVTDASPAMSPEVHKGLRRSSRPWRPSAAALEHIAAKDMSRDVAALIDDILVQDDDQVLHAGVQNPFFVSDLAHATQDLEVPRSYAQILRLPEPEKTKWLQACQRESKSHLAIPSISEAMRPDLWTQAPPIRLTWVFSKKDVYKARIVMLGQHMQEGVHFNDTHAPVPTVPV